MVTIVDSGLGIGRVDVELEYSNRSQLVVQRDVQKARRTSPCPFSSGRQPAYTARALRRRST